MSSPSPLSGSSADGGGDLERDQFEADELAIALSHYDLPVIRRIRACRRGSRRSPKVRIDTDLGQFLLKRRAVGRDDARRVEFAHALHTTLEAARYPVPRLVPLRDGSTMLRLGRRIYELFEFIRGTRDDGSTPVAVRAGEALGAFHALLEGVEPPAAVPTASFHASAAVESALRQVPSMVTAAASPVPEPEVEACCAKLAAAYRDAADRVERLGFASLPGCVLHGDWHPGNLLYHDGVVVGVLDLDSVRFEPRVVDLANAALQFSMAMPENRDPRDWPEKISARRVGAMVQGYGDAAASPLTTAELAMLPWLMIEALVVEAVVPIAATGRFARLDGGAFLVMIERKIDWIAPRAEKLVAHLRERAA